MGFKLFFTFLKFGLFCFGGGNAMVSVFERSLVYDNRYITLEQFGDMIAISQITPGPLAVNLATYVGAALGDSPPQSIYYSFMATFGMSLPAFVVVVVVANFFRRFGESKYVKAVMGGVSPAVIGLILGAAVVLCKLSLYDVELFSSGEYFRAINLLACFITILAFILSIKTNLSPVLILIGCGGLGVLLL